MKTEVWQELEAIAQRYFDQCDKQLHRGGTHIFNYAKMSLMEYDFLNHPTFKDINFTLPKTGRIVKARLSLKPGTGKRPLVIFQCGLTCEQDNPSTRFMSMIFHDMGPFHILLLPSNSSDTFVKDNKVFAIGGLEEGRQIIHIASELTSEVSPYADRISQIHLFGASLGGHSSFYAALYSQYRERQIGATRSLLSTVAVGCPVVDLGTSLDHITGDAFIAKILRSTLLRNVADLLLLIPFFSSGEFGSVNFRKPAPNELRSILKEGAFDYYKNATQAPDWGLPPFDGVKIDTREQLWEASNVAKWPVEYLKRPVFSWAPKDDNIVLYQDNSQVLYAKDRTFTERMIFSLETEKGGHCTYPSVFGWRATSAMLNGLFLARSPELLEKRYEVKKTLYGKYFRSLRDASRAKRRRSVTLLAVQDKDYVKVRSVFVESPCRRAGQKSRGVCKKTEHNKLPLSFFGLKSDRIPRTKMETEILTRWLNARVTFYDKDGREMAEDKNPYSIGTVHYRID